MDKKLQVDTRSGYSIQTDAHSRKKELYFKDKEILTGLDEIQKCKDDYFVIFVKGKAGLILCTEQKIKYIIKPKYLDISMKKSSDGYKITCTFTDKEEEGEQKLVYSYINNKLEVIDEGKSETIKENFTVKVNGKWVSYSEYTKTLSEEKQEDMQTALKKYEQEKKKAKTEPAVVDWTWEEKIKDEKAVAEIIKQDVNTLDVNGKSLLMYQASKGNDSGIKYLLSFKNINLLIKDNDGLDVSDYCSPEFYFDKFKKLFKDESKIAGLNRNSNEFTMINGMDVDIQLADIKDEFTQNKTKTSGYSQKRFYIIPEKPNIKINGIIQKLETSKTLQKTHIFLNINEEGNFVGDSYDKLLKENGKDFDIEKLHVFEYSDINTKKAKFTAFTKEMYNEQKEIHGIIILVNKSSFNAKINDFNALLTLISTKRIFKQNSQKMAK